MEAIDDILLFLKRRDAVSTREIAGALGISRQAASVRLAQLFSDGLIESRNELRGVGRPRKLWSSTTRADGLFPDAHAQVSVELIEGIRETFGEAGLDRIIAAREAQAEAGYEQAMAGAGSLRERVARLAHIRTQEGYMACWTESEHGFLLVENHCPICAVARACQGFCRSELAIFRRVLGPEAHIERTDHIIEGARRCAYRITPA